MNSLVETIEYRGYNIEVHADHDAESPAAWGNTDYFLVYDHRDFNVEVKGFDPNEIYNDLTTGKRKLYSQWGSKDTYHVFPVYAYIHGGVSLSLGRSGWPFNCPWDTSMKGFAMVKREKGSWTERAARKIAESVVNEWNDYLSGNVYGFITKDSEDNQLDSCWGFYGDPKDYMIGEAQGSIDAHINDKLSTHLKQLKQWIINKVNIIYRQPLTLSI